jgi:hypothetical protein
MRMIRFGVLVLYPRWCAVNYLLLLLALTIESNVIGGKWYGELERNRTEGNRNRHAALLLVGGKCPCWCPNMQGCTSLCAPCTNVKLAAAKGRDGIYRADMCGTCGLHYGSQRLTLPAFCRRVGSGYQATFQVSATAGSTWTGMQESLDIRRSGVASRTVGCVDTDKGTTTADAAAELAGAGSSAMTGEDKDDGNNSPNP